MSETRQSSNLARQYLTFTLGRELFALDIHSVREILELETITRIPRTPEYMRGVLNLRGRALPVMDMRFKFGLERADITVESCVIVIEVPGDEGLLELGALVDSVSEVVEFRPEDIAPPPRLGASVDTAFIKGMGHVQEDFVIVLDAPRVFSLEELSVADAVQAPAPDGPSLDFPAT